MKMSQMVERLKGPKDEKGGGLLSLLGIGSVVLTISLSVAGAAAFGAKITHENLAGQQAMDAVDSAVSEALFNLSHGTCEPTGFDSTLKYSYQVYSSAEATAPTTMDAPGLTAGCPTDLDRWVLIHSEGEGKNNTVKNSITTYKWVDSNARVIPQLVTGQQITLSTVEMLGSSSGLTTRPVIYSKNGGVSCVDSLPSLKKINISVDDAVNPVNCAVTGDIRATNDVDLNSSGIQGDACSTGFLYNGSQVDGDIIENAVSCGVTGTMYGYKPHYAENTIVIPPGTCSNFAQFKQVVETPYEEPTILNATGCGEELNNMLITPGNKNFNIGSNELTIVTDQNTSILDLTVTASNGPSSLSFAIPSSESNSTQSTCLLSATLNLENVTYEDGASGMFYSPCSTNIVGSDISGQVYGGNNVSISNSNIRYYPVELVNADSVVGDGSFQKHLVRVF